MVKHLVDDYLNLIESLSVSEQEKAQLAAFAKAVDRDALRLDFQMKRIQKDKSIIINLLNKTIEDLRTQKEITEKANRDLVSQKAAVETANQKLKAQNTLVEEQSKKLAENLDALEMSYHELEQFSYIASHDLKSPLRTISSYAGLLKRRYRGKLDADADEFLNFIIKGTNNMNLVIRDLLEYSRAGRERVFEDTDLNETLDLVKFNLHEEILENQAVIEFDPLPKLYVHRSGILQVFQNLVANAIKFRGEASPHISILCRQDSSCWQFTVSDNGLGMDEAYQEKAFLPFQRVNHLDRPGTGMGLAICKKIVRMHHGDIWYQSQMGMGTTFNFTLAQQG
ncbi:MAG: ATP-binding protein [Bacteroidota bacterium]